MAAGISQFKGPNTCCLQIPAVLTPDQVGHCRRILARADWVDGKVTAGYESAKVKRNAQLPEESAAATELGDIILTALEGNKLFISAALPSRVFPPLFNRYGTGDGFGAHVDNAIRQGSRPRRASAPTSPAPCS